MRREYTSSNFYRKLTITPTKLFGDWFALDSGNVTVALCYYESEAILLKNTIYEKIQQEDEIEIPPERLEILEWI
jgi:hypothetical protein